MPTVVSAGPLQDLAPGTARKVEVGGRMVALVRIGDDVYAIGDTCSHASTVGPIDEEQRFYLESRGVPPTVAERLIVLGFFDEVLDQLPAPDLVPGLRRQVRAKLDRKDA